MTTNGWILDAYVEREEVLAWVITSYGARVPVRFKVEPICYVGNQLTDAQVRELIAPFNGRVTFQRAQMHDIFLNRQREVIALAAPGFATFSALTRYLRARHSLELFNCDIEPVQMFFYRTGLFPFCGFSAEIDHEGKALSFKTEDSEWRVDYSIPELRVIYLRLEGEKLNPKYNWKRRVVVECQGNSCTYECEDSEDFIRAISEYISRVGPDVIFSKWGDSFILPELCKVAEMHNVGLHLNREGKRVIRKKEREIFTYGRVIYQAGWFCLRGRLHIDETNSFIIKEGGMRSLIEISRLARVPVQRMARTSPGTAMSSMQLYYADKNDILIPLEKSQHEEFKTADLLIKADRGGLVYRPTPGLYESVCEIDFASMFPSIMVNYNVSTETVNCKCCTEAVVPELGYHICKKRRGIVPAVLEPLLKKRVEFKRLKKAAKAADEASMWDDIQGGIKWMLVTCFRYLGYRNARFGKIEAHESVTAISRELLLTAKEIAESRGFSFIHGIVDSLYVHKDGASDSDYASLSEEITRRTGISADIEGMYNWLLFVPRKQLSFAGVHNRFVGAFRSGKIKIRGLAARRHDIPSVARVCQTAMITVLSKARNAAEYRALLPEARRVLETTIAKLKDGDVPITELLWVKNLSNSTDGYTSTSPSGIVCRQYARYGIRLSPGMRIMYLVSDRKSRVPEERYTAFYGSAFAYDVDIVDYISVISDAADNLNIPDVLL